MPKVASLHIYPVKSCQGHRLDRIELDGFGPVGDRRWLIVSEGKPPFVTRRNCPKLALIETEILDGDSIRLKAPGCSPVEASLIENSGPLRKAVIWKSECQARDAGDPVAEWLSHYIGSPVRLVGMDQAFARPIAKSPQDQVSFADGYPILIVSQASLDDLNARLDEETPMSRFRPNIVVEGCEPFEEDEWRRIRIGDCLLKAAGRCARCIMTTIDQQSGEKAGPEPLSTLASYRTSLKGVVFGQNYINESKTGSIEAGMEIEIID